MTGNSIDEGVRWRGVGRINADGSGLQFTRRAQAVAVLARISEGDVGMQDKDTEPEAGADAQTEHQLPQQNTVPAAAPGATPRRRRSRGTAGRAKSGRKVAAPKAATKSVRTTAEHSRQRGPARSFPASSFAESLTLATAIWQFAAGERVRRLTLFDSLDKSPESGPSRQLITNSTRYGLTTGSYAAEYLELTPIGSIASNPDSPLADRLQAQVDLGIKGIPPFAALYENYKGKKLPGHAVIKDFLKDHGVPEADAQECIDTFIVNAKGLGMLRTISGAERIISTEQLLEEAQRGTPIEPEAPGAPVALATAPVVRSRVPGATARPASEWSSICFYVTPIGREGSEERQHSDLFLSSIVEPAVAEFGLQVVRADQIGKPGMITAQIIEHLVKARLVVADLSFHNPNVFYEVALRHACRLPIVQLTRAADPIPFDLDQFRTVQVDTTSIYTLVPRLESLRSEVANQIRRALSDPADVDNPLTVFYPAFWDAISKKPS